MIQGKIKILSESLSNQIAAGEVIDRPSSVVKELVENAIDAGASEISVIVRDGGKTLVQVIDNGHGMIEADAILAFERHSTSKIATAEDLQRIQTMGFRGEALASIGSVSRVELRTCIPAETAATHLLLEGGLIQEVGKSAGKTGTSIAVKNLFFNTPARRKFLKSDLAEYRHILQVLNRYFLAFPKITFHFFKNDGQVYALTAADLQERIIQVFGEKFRANLIAVEFSHEIGKVSGYVGNMDLFRRSRGDQYLFLHRRFIQNKNLNWAVMSAYQSMLPRGSHPFYCLFLEVNPETVDVNVHPSKIEVRFEDERQVYRLIHRAVKEALLADEVVPVLRTTKLPPDQEFITVPFGRPRGEQPLPVQRRKGIPASPGELAFPFEFRKARRKLTLIPGDRQQREESPEPQSLPVEAAGDRVSIWQLHNKYIFSQIKSGLIIVDQHLAHERILYERALQAFNQARPVAQQQLFPKTVQLTPGDFEILLEMQFYLSRIGFVVREFGRNTVMVEAVPAELRHRDEETTLREMIDEYKESKEPDIREKIAKAFSCKSAIKAGDPLSSDEAVALIDNLFATRNPYFCPHGRPIIVTIPLEELDRRFLRI